ncbi:MAG: RNA ligase partner protein [Candidatus Omnitrophica bacterium]|nr:RNA ligase partner protein [Candidatus Omnitrophota bacterium]
MKSTPVVLDTSIFVNPDSRRFFGRNPRHALLSFLKTADAQKKLNYYMPPSVFEELMKFIEPPLTPEELVPIRKKPPSTYQSALPALFFYELVESLRLRVNKGLRIAEKYTRKGLKAESDRKKEEYLIKHLREEYRVALREGILDSKEDFDLILLAKELNALLATSDHGLMEWAHKLGIVCLGPEELHARVEKAK